MSARACPTTRPGRRGGFSALELGVAVLVITVVGVLLLRSLALAQAAAERATVEMTVMNLRSLLRLTVARTLIEGDAAKLQGLAGANPVQWMRPPPPGYRGELEGAALEGLAPGTWAFDRARRELVYRPSHDDDLDWPAQSPHMLRWQVRTGGPTGLTRGIDLAAVNAVPWAGAPLK